MERLLTLMLLCAIGLAASFTPRAGAQSPAPRFDQQLALPGSSEAKLPHIAVSGGAVHIAANSGQLDANYWTRPAGAASFAPPERLGPALGQPDYSTASVAAEADGRIYYAWINQPERAIYLRVRSPGGVWGPAIPVVRGAPFPVAVEVAASEGDELFVLWRNPDRPFVFSRSGDAGRSWSAPRPISAGAGYNAPAVAAGGGVVALAYTQGEGDRLQIFAGLWRGDGFTPARISWPWGDFADPSVAVSPTGQAVAAWRGVADAGGSAGVFVAERTPAGAWPVYRLAGGKVLGRVTAAHDERGGLHLLWIGEAGRVAQLWYAYRPQGGAWVGPVAAPASGGAIFNAHGAAGLAGGSLYAHAVSEVFVGDRVTARAYRFVAGASAPRGQPLLEGGAPRSRRETLALSFAELAGEPRELRWRWGAPPAAETPWGAYATRTELPAPAGAGVSRCEPLTLYTQLRGAGGAQEPAATAQIVLDRAVQASVRAQSPAGAPGYTSVPTALLAVDATADCSGLVSVRPAQGAQPQAAAGARFSLPITLPAVEGPHAVSVELADGLGNSRWYSLTLTYDATPPRLAGGALTISADTRASVLQTLRLHGASYSDAGAQAPWAVAVAVGRAPIAPADPALRWVALPLPPGAASLARDGTLALHVELSLATLLPAAQLGAGDYFYALRLVDAAGNQSAAVVNGSVRIAQVTYPRLYLPHIQQQ